MIRLQSLTLMSHRLRATLLYIVNPSRVCVWSIVFLFLCSYGHIHGVYEYHIHIDVCKWGWETVEALLISRREKEEFAGNHSEPQHGPNDLGEALSSLRLKFTSAQEVWMVLISKMWACRERWREQWYAVLNRILLSFPPIKIPSRCFFWLASFSLKMGNLKQKNSVKTYDFITNSQCKMCCLGSTLRFLYQ